MIPVFYRAYTSGWATGLNLYIIHLLSIYVHVPN